MDVTVFVDDAVRGRLPDICVTDGVATTSRLRVVEEIGRSNRVGILWLLVFAGPIGWIILLFLLSRDSGEHLTVELPFSVAANTRLQSANRMRTSALVIGVFGTIALLVLTAWAGLGAAGYVMVAVAIGGACIALIVAEYRIGRVHVGVSLDASRRWVTLRAVHPAFGAACAERDRASAGRDAQDRAYGGA